MAINNFIPCLEIVLPIEGAYVDDPNDPGGATNFGITLNTFSKWLGYKATKEQLKSIDQPTVRIIYNEFYWNPNKCEKLSAGIDLCIFDWCVNSGIRNVLLGLKIDSLDKMVRVLQTGRAIDQITWICSQRMKYLKGLLGWGHYGNGWTNRVNNIQSKSTAMVNATS